MKKHLSKQDWFFLTLFLVFLFLSTGCASVGAPQPTAPPPKYELMLSGLIDGASFQGIGVGSSDRHHDLVIKSAIAVNYFTLQSCHRSIQFADVIKVNWYDWSNDNKSFSWAYDESPTIEDSGDCILRFCAFSKTVGSPPVACAIVDFKNEKYSLPSENICNGALNAKATGTSICHTQTGLIERMRFQSPVVTAPQVSDPAGKTAPYWIKNQCLGKFLDQNQTLFEYQVPENECVLIFMEKAQPHRRAKLTVIPYDTAQYPGGS